MQTKKVATYAGGCFWGIEELFTKVKGVFSVKSGYSDGRVKNPKYFDVASGLSGHAEAVQVTYDPKVISYEELSKLFFEFHDPTQLNYQGEDIGTQYRSAIFYNDEEEHKTAQKLIDILKNKGYKIVTELKPASVFYPAEEYHQGFLNKHPERQCHIPVKRFD